MGGPCQVSRDPAFAGQPVLPFRVAGAASAVTALGAAGLLWMSARAEIRTEKRVREARFGDRYRVYCIRVPRCLGAAVRPAGAVEGSSVSASRSSSATTMERSS